MNRRISRKYKFVGFVLVFVFIQVLVGAQNSNPELIVVEKKFVGTISRFWRGGGAEPPAFRFHTQAGNEIVIAAGKCEQFGGNWGEYDCKDILDDYLGTPSSAKKSIVWEVTCKEKHYKGSNFTYYDVVSIDVYSEKKMMSESGFSQNIKVKVTEAFSNRPLSGITIYGSVEEKHYTATTNNTGMAEFTVNEVLNLILVAADPNKVYGFGAHKVASSQNIYEIQLTKYPANEREAGEMVDQILEALSFGVDLYELFELGKNLTASTGAGLFGIPGVFSISPIPVRGPDDQFGFSLSGTLAKDLMRFATKITSGKYQCVYDCSYSGTTSY